MTNVLIIRDTDWAWGPQTLLNKIRNELDIHFTYNGIEHNAHRDTLETLVMAVMMGILSACEPESNYRVLSFEHKKGELTDFQKSIMKNIKTVLDSHPLGFVGTYNDMTIWRFSEAVMYVLVESAQKQSVGKSLSVAHYFTG